MCSWRRSQAAPGQTGTRLQPPCSCLRWHQPRGTPGSSRHGSAAAQARAPACCCHPSWHHPCLSCLREDRHRQRHVHTHVSVTSLVPFNYARQRGWLEAPVWYQRRQQHIHTTMQPRVSQPSATGCDLAATCMPLTSFCELLHGGVEQPSQPRRRQPVTGCLPQLRQLHQLCQQPSSS